MSHYQQRVVATCHVCHVNTHKHVAHHVNSVTNIHLSHRPHTTWVLPLWLFILPLYCIFILLLSSLHQWSLIWIFLLPTYHYEQHPRLQFAVIQFLFAAATVHILSTHPQFLTATPCRPWTDFQGCDIARTPPMDVAYNNFIHVTFQISLEHQSRESSRQSIQSINAFNRPVNKSREPIQSIRSLYQYTHPINHPVNQSSESSSQPSSQPSIQPAVQSIIPSINPFNHQVNHQVNHPTIHQPSTIQPSINHPPASRPVNHPVNQSIQSSSQPSSQPSIQPSAIHQAAVQPTHPVNPSTQSISVPGENSSVTNPNGSFGSQ
ncbi:Pc21g15060 [Penicillium rubens Wisconsin 54-1255]|uniref:Pc21g15060 protein n=1 Tax=Penicillium rubens (strain ATCC 28089 / DSM 1075 / NRRL 1951 / Wisconsin 54-1255) TaxID=500485 RepID=B6HJ21_PENRW|nr:Pc21g15060 [Penicillium rubens Wisconsin 54-1255]